MIINQLKFEFMEAIFLIEIWMNTCNFEKIVGMFQENNLRYITLSFRTSSVGLRYTCATRSYPRGMLLFVAITRECTGKPLWDSGLAIEK